MHVYVTEPQEIEPEALELLRQAGYVVIENKEDAQGLAAQIQVLFVRTYTQVNKVLLDAFPAVRYVLRAGVGLDNVDIEACKARGIRVINSPGANSHAVAEYVIGTAIAMLRNMSSQETSLREGGWRQKEYMGTELRGKMLGLIGCGNVGALIARKLSNWELEGILGYDPYQGASQMAQSGIRKVELDEVLKGSDVISVHVPLVPDTAHLISTEAFAKMKPSALLINAARGGVVDESALVAALGQQKIAGAVLDVFEGEPVVSPGVLEAQPLLVTPHIAGYTFEANREVSLSPVRELLRIVGGTL